MKQKLIQRLKKKLSLFKINDMRKTKTKQKPKQATDKTIKAKQRPL